MTCNTSVYKLSYISQFQIIPPVGMCCFMNKTVTKKKEVPTKLTLHKLLCCFTPWIIGQNDNNIKVSKYFKTTMDDG